MEAAPLFALLGPGLVTGVADDDLSGIATYSIVGAQLGTSMLWTALLTFRAMNLPSLKDFFLELVFTG